MINTRQRVSEAGNALFLILIAVVLFAALSYAITQSNRSSGNASSETNLVSSSTITQYPSAIRTGITRMLLHGLADTDIQFHDPANYTAPNTNEVFHPSGGGVVYENVDPQTVNAVIPIATNPTSNWYFYHSSAPGNNEIVVPNVGTAAGDLVAILFDVKTAICSKIDEQITGSTTIPVLTGITAAALKAGSVTLPATVNGQPFLCAQTSDGTDVYYHVLVEK
jgi:hypothetical protein